MLLSTEFSLSENRRQPRFAVDLRNERASVEHLRSAADRFSNRLSPLKFEEAFKVLRSPDVSIASKHFDLDRTIGHETRHLTLFSSSFL